MGSFLTQIRFPTMLGLAVLALGLGSGVYLTLQNRPLTSQAAPDQVPIDIKVTNVESDSVTISWRTNTEIESFISFGKDGGERTALDVRDKDKPLPHSLHYVVLNKLTPQTTYKYKIVSGKLRDLPEEQFTTAAEISSQNGSKPVIGNVVDSNRSLDEGIVYLDIPGATSQSALAKNLGSFIIPTNSIRTEDLSDLFTPNGEEAKLTAISKDGKQGTTTFQIAYNNSTIQTIKIGEEKTSTPDESENTLGIFTTFGQIGKDNFDLTGDNKLNSLDYAALLKNFGAVPPKDKKYDLNADGVINKKDQDILSFEIAKSNR
jgi:hypothetical protein